MDDNWLVLMNTIDMLLKRLVDDDRPITGSEWKIIHEFNNKKEWMELGYQSGIQSD